MSAKGIMFVLPNASCFPSHWEALGDGAEHNAHKPSPRISPKVRGRKQFRIFLTLALVTIFGVGCLAAVGVTNASTQHSEAKESKHGFSVTQYEDFHEVLHPLEHEALPNNDFARIRSKAVLLVKRGNAIVKLGVPGGVAAANREEFASSLNKFKEALARFKTDAKKGSDEQLKVSYGAVHDSFEMLAGMLPQN